MVGMIVRHDEVLCGWLKWLFDLVWSVVGLAGTGHLV